MNPTPYNHGGLLVGCMYRPRQSPQYAQGWEPHIPMKKATRSRLFRYLLRLVIAAALLLFIFATLLGVHGVHVV